MADNKSTQTIGGIIDANSGLGPGFNTLRLVLSVAVMCWHSLPLCYGYDFEQRIWISPVGRPFMLIMPIFFGLSGFLVMGSAIRLASLTPFLLSRGLRIVPALATEITISGVLVGGIFTSLPLSQYFVHPDFFRYFGSLIGKVVFSLPGVDFPHNPYGGLINNNLWTIPPELLCYIYLALVIVTGYFRNKWTITIAAAAITLLNLGYDLSVGYESMDNRWPARYLVMAFAYGNAAFLWRHAIPYNRATLLATLGVGCIGLRTPLLIYISLLCLTYVMTYIGTTRLPMPSFLRKGDYSYGIYLYGFPVQQIVLHLLPGTKEFYWNILIAVPIATLIAMASWHFVEKPALSLRSKIQNWLGPDSSPTRPWAVFAALVCLISYGAFLLRFSYIAFSEQMSWFVAAKYISVVVGAAIICMIAKMAAQWSGRSAAQATT
jgi:peptidoglycan/LPS O-acetylase OafA/YrhL